MVLNSEIKWDWNNYDRKIQKRKNRTVGYAKVIHQRAIKAGEVPKYTSFAKIIPQTKEEQIEACWNGYEIEKDFTEEIERDLNIKFDGNKQWNKLRGGLRQQKAEDRKNAFAIIETERSLEKLTSQIARAEVFGLDATSFVRRDISEKGDSKTYHHSSKIGDSKRNLFIRNVSELKNYIAQREQAEKNDKFFDTSIYVLGNKLMEDLVEKGLKISTTDLDKISLLEIICTQQDCGTRIEAHISFTNIQPEVNSVGTKAQISKVIYAMENDKMSQLKVKEVQSLPPKLVVHSPIYGSRSLN